MAQNITALCKIVVIIFFPTKLNTIGIGYCGRLLYDRLISIGYASKMISNIYKRAGGIINHMRTIYIKFVVLFTTLLLPKCNIFYLYVQRRVDDFSFFDCLSPFSFLLIEFHFTFSIFSKYYHILFIIIVFTLQGKVDVL